MISKIAQLCTVALSFICTAHAEEHLSLPAPFLNADGSKPAGQENRFVFLLPSSEDAVVLYPRRRQDGSKDLNDVIKVQVELSRHVKPSILSQAARDSADPGVFEYSYILANGKGARKSAWHWLFEGVVDSNSVTVIVPENWAFAFPRVTTKELPLPDSVREKTVLFRALKIFASDGSGSVRIALGVEAGTQLGGLKLRSRKRPGLLDVYVQGGMTIPEFPNEPPEQVADELREVITSLYNYQHTFCFGPRFDENSDALTIARAFNVDLDRLISGGTLRADSPFVSNGKALLSSGIPGMQRIRAWAESANTTEERQFAAMFLLAMPETHN